MAFRTEYVPRTNDGVFSMYRYEECEYRIVEQILSWYRLGLPLERFAVEKSHLHLSALRSTFNAEVSRDGVPAVTAMQNPLSLSDEQHIEIYVHANDPSRSCK
eukprot:2851184-Pleurochrysis_carterae.AAC.2